MIVRPLHLTVFFALTCTMSLSMGCSSEKKTSTYTGPTCAQWQQASKAKKPYHPRLWTGKVSALPKASASSSWWISEAHAFAYKQERPVANVTVEVFRVDARFKPRTPAPLATATTNSKGQWCMIAPADLALGSGVLLRAKTGDLTQRQLAVFHKDLSINAQSEALIRLLLDRGVSPTQLDMTNYMNIRTMADTAAGLLGQVKISPTTTQTELITRAQKAMSTNKRLMDTIKKVYAKPPKMKP